MTDLASKSTTSSRILLGVRHIFALALKPALGMLEYRHSWRWRRHLGRKLRPYYCEPDYSGQEGDAEDYWC
jgi:hypothetical protein